MRGEEAMEFGVCCKHYTLTGARVQELSEIRGSKQVSNLTHFERLKSPLIPLWKRGKLEVLSQNLLIPLHQLTYLCYHQGKSLRPCHNPIMSGVLQVREIWILG